MMRKRQKQPRGKLMGKPNMRRLRQGEGIPGEVERGKTTDKLRASISRLAVGSKRNARDLLARADFVVKDKFSTLHRRSQKSQSTTPSYPPSSSRVEVVEADPEPSPDPPSASAIDLVSDIHEPPPPAPKESFESMESLDLAILPPPPKLSIQSVSSLESEVPPPPPPIDEQLIGRLRPYQVASVPRTVVSGVGLENLLNVSEQRATKITKLKTHVLRQLSDDELFKLLVAFLREKDSFEARYEGMDSSMSAEKKAEFLVKMDLVELDKRMLLKYRSSLSDFYQEKYMFSFEQEQTRLNNHLQRPPRQSLLSVKTDITV